MKNARCDQEAKIIQPPNREPQNVDLKKNPQTDFKDVRELDRKEAEEEVEILNEESFKELIGR